MPVEHQAGKARAMAGLAAVCWLDLKINKS